MYYLKYVSIFGLFVGIGVMISIMIFLLSPVFLFAYLLNILLSVLCGLPSHLGLRLKRSDTNEKL